MYTDRDGNADLLQEEAYYPFGMRIPDFSNDFGAEEKYLYNGKELEDRIKGFHFSDYGARFYDPALGCWHSVDPLAEKGREWSPYTYCFNNPMNLIDPDGRWAFWTKAKNLVYNWMGLPGAEEAEEKSSLSKDELADGTNKSEGEGIAGLYMLDEVPVVRASGGDAISEKSDGFLLEGEGNITAGIQAGYGLRKGADVSLNAASWSLLSGKFNNQTGVSGYYVCKDGEVRISQGGSASFYGGIQYKHDFSSNNGVVSNETHTVSFGLLGLLAHDRVYNGNGELLNTFSGISINFQAAFVVGIDVNYKMGYYDKN